MQKWLLIIASVLIFSAGVTFQYQLDQMHRLCSKQKEIIELDQVVIEAQLTIIDILDIQVAAQIKQINELKVAFPNPEEN